MKNIELIIIYPTLDGNHYKSHVCQGICTESDGIYSIQFLKTKKWFDERRFRLSPGDQLGAPETDREFTVTEVTCTVKRPKYITVTATLNDKRPRVKRPEISGGIAS